MSFNRMKEKVEYGDTVLVHVGFDNMLPFIVQKGVTHQTKFGAVRHDKLIGKKYGTKFQCPRGWVYIMHPTPELWTLSLPHRTQILYTTDISMVIFQLDLKPGSVVVEAGTGSGSLSHAILRTIQPSGHLHTFEFHEERSMKAREEFEDHGLSQFVTVTHRDVCGDGFQLEGVADAVFLDLPRPWECVGSAKKAMKTEGGRICTFSPCIEQVQRSCEELSKHGFSEISTMECLLRNYNIQFAKLQNMNFGDDDAEDSKTSVKDAEDPSATSPVKGDGDSGKNGSDDCTPAKVAKQEPEVTTPKSSNPKSKTTAGSSEVSSYCFTSAVPALPMQGHTGFLTFASLLTH
ncbi:tRNA (adenine(58)-N(1))-methyltransferase catalytic subunit TRMT61A [Aplysia californica]|uniref:tRNA (adenine(58)-N(1))-methyltransferase catalytic subunit TRMT61A n=1 Tax=Aplysia californica TaxID=6500 RepID=A0ABM0JAJ2_APLCA|nr:tRNA (adenine(58)-N(1))-methyltransferase catalytic subunit TRMT61A [Aplysia californica]